jgi:hypothetical protein
MALALMVNFTGAVFRRSLAAVPVSLALPAWGHADSPWKVDGKVLAGGAANRHSSIRSSNPGGRCSQGGVKVPTGGKGELAQARERLVPSFGKKGQQIRCDSEADG